MTHIPERFAQPGGRVEHQGNAQRRVSIRKRSARFFGDEVSKPAVLVRRRDEAATNDGIHRGVKTMKFLVLAFGDEKKCTALTEGEMRTLGQKCAAYDEELRATGRLVGAGSLAWASKTLRLKGGKLQVTDGPFSEAKEVVGGFVIIEANDYDEAVKLASLHPAARMGEELGWGIELRPMEACLLQEIAKRG